MAAYSFKDITASLAGPGGTIVIGIGSGAADEGITVERSEDRNTMQTGADTHVTHSLHAANAGTVRLRLLKTSTTNGLLLNMLKLQLAVSALHGRNVISIQDTVRGDKVTCTEVSFAGEPALAFGKVAQVQEWTFHAGHVEATLDTGVAPEEA